MALEAVGLGVGEAAEAGDHAHHPIKRGQGFGRRLALGNDIRRHATRRGRTPGRKGQDGAAVVNIDRVVADGENGMYAGVGRWVPVGADEVQACP
jgi:hypothetical protein